MATLESHNLQQNTLINYVVEENILPSFAAKKKIPSTKEMNDLPKEIYSTPAITNIAATMAISEKQISFNIATK